jgi:hypothetical protein
MYDGKITEVINDEKLMIHCLMKAWMDLLLTGIWGWMALK